MKSDIWLEVQEGFLAFLSDNASYLCEYCNITFQIEDALDDHIERIHRVARHKYKEDNPNYVQFRPENNCHICYESIESVTGHLESAHGKMSMEVYYMRYLFQERSYTPAINNNNDYSNPGQILPQFKENDKVSEGEKKEMVMVKQENIENAREKTRYECQTCDFKTTHQSHLKRHQRSHTGEKPFACDYCKKQFSYKNNLIVHVRLHTGEQQYKCDYCDKSFGQKGNLNSHIASLHKRETCRHCHEKFDQEDCLKVHEEMCKEKMKTCQTCGFKAQFRCLLKQHETKHTGEKLFQCDHCKKSFKSRKYLKKHVIIFHKEQKPSVVADYGNDVLENLSI